MMEFFNFNDIDSRDLGIAIRTKRTYDSPERDITEIEVPGRNGNLIFDNGKYKNLPLSYGIRIVAPDFEINPSYSGMAYALNEIKKAFKSDGNYHILYDSYEPDYFYYACRKGGIRFDVKNPTYADAEINFTCKPHKYRFDGQIKHEVTGHSIVLTNPESEPALPLIKIYGSGTAKFVCNGITREISNVTSYVLIDSENMTLQTTGNSAPVAVTFTSFPKIETSATFTLLQGIKMEITPRWRTI